MAIFYLETKPIKRSEGRSSVAASAYRAGVSLVDNRTGVKHSYEKKGKNGVVSKDCFMYQDGQKIQLDRSELWNTAEKAEKRKDARTGRDFIANLPFELSPKQRENIVREFSKTITKLYKVAVDWAIHLPDKKGDNRNHHAHILITTRQAKLENGQVVLGDKTNLEKENKELKKQGLPLTQDQIKSLRKEWEVITNHHLAMAGIEERIDCRSYREQGIQKLPTVKLGARASENERNGIATRKGDYNRLVEKANSENWQGTMEEYIEKTIYDLELEIIVESRAENNAQKSQKLGDIQRQEPAPIETTRQTITKPQTHEKGQNESPRPSKPKLSLEEKMARWEQKQERERQINERGEQALSRFEQRMQQHEQRLAEKAEKDRLAQLEQQREAELAEQARLAQLEQQRQAEQVRLAEIARKQKEYENRNSRGFSP
jgi:hypothetical protein